MTEELTPAQRANAAEAEAIGLRADVEKLTAENAALEEKIKDAMNVLFRIRDGHYKHNKCLAPRRCCPTNRLCFPCIVDDALARLTEPAPEKKP